MEYLDYYGLDFDPFELPVDAIFSTAGGRGLLLEKIEHLVAFSELNIFIYGQEGIGKTNFLKNLVSVPSSMWKSIYAPVSTETKLDDILEFVLSQYRLTLSKSTSLEVVSAEICENLQSDNSSILLLCIDDAHLLSPDLFEQLNALKKNFDKFEVQLKILFSGEQNDLEENCNFAEDTNQSYHLFLKSLTLEETKSYLTVYFQKAGRSEKIPLGLSDIKRIYEMSQGVPSRINTLTPEYLIQSLDQPINGFQWPVVKVSIGLISLVLLISLFYYKQFEQPKHNNSSAITQLDDSPKMPNSEVLGKVNSVIEKLEQANEQQLILEAGSVEEVMNDAELDVEARAEAGLDAESVVLGLEINELSTGFEEELVDAIVEELDVELEPKSESQPESESMPEFESKLEPEELLDIEFVSEAEVFEKTPQGIENDWFRSNNGWVVQVLGSYSEQSVIDFMEQNNQYQWKKYNRLLNDKSYFVVVLAGFDTKSQAVDALSKASKKIKQMDTWIRSIESIRPLLIP